MAQENKVKEAIQVLKQTELSRSYDRAYVARMLGVFYWQNEQIPAAISSLKVAVESNELQDEQAWSTRKMLADLLTSQQEYRPALKHYYVLSESIPTNQKGDELWLRISQLHFQLQEWKSVLKGIKQYAEFQSQDAVLPLSLQLGAELNLEQWKPAIATLKRLLALEPQKSAWWRQLVSLELRVGLKKEALSTLALAKMQKVELNQQDLRLLAQLYAQNGVPERAARVMETLEEAESNLQLITERAIYWQRAKEWDHAIKTLRLASTKDAKYHWYVAQLLLQEGHYEQALAELDQVKERDRQAQVALAKTRALYKLNQLEAALVQAKRAESIQASESAKQWIKYLSQQRQAQTTQDS
ncbi:tPR domain protein putative component of TonB system [Vibrio mimicus MB451]|nr:tPR domain protein putative component of TonB system [Vibrio mimicus MB451]